MDEAKTQRIVVASKNPVKAAAISGAFEQLFPDQPFEIELIAAASGVSDQPMSDAETRTGAENRVAAARLAQPDADLWAGLEGGVEFDSTDEAVLNAFAWIIVDSRDSRGAARTATFPLPPAVAELIRNGVELGDADDQIFGRANSKQEEGAIGILTGGLIDRRALYEHAALMAMIPLRNRQLFTARS